MFLSRASARTLSLSSAVMDRTPMIRFRYGAARQQSGSQGSGGHKQAGHSQPAVAHQAAAATEIPARYRRAPLSEEEIAYINRGGPE